MENFCGMKEVNLCYLDLGKGIGLMMYPFSQLLIVLFSSQQKKNVKVGSTMRL